MKRVSVCITLALLGLVSTTQAAIIVSSCELDQPVRFASGDIVSTKAESPRDRFNADMSYPYKDVTLVDKEQGEIGSLGDTRIRTEFSDDYGVPNSKLFSKKIKFQSRDRRVTVTIAKAGKGVAKMELQAPPTTCQANIVTKIPVKLTRKDGLKSETQSANLKCFTYYHGTGFCNKVNMTNSQFVEEMFSFKKVDDVYKTLK